MKTGSIIVALALVTGLAGCPDDPVEPGQIVAKFSTFPRQCSDLRLATIEARAVKSNGVVENSASVPCVRDGEVLLENITPGTYTVEILGYNTDPDPKATYGGEVAGVVVTEGATKTTDAIGIAQLPSSVRVFWLFANGQFCVDNNVDEVSVALTDSQLQPVKPMQRVDCTNTFPDPTDPSKQSSGVLFEGIALQATNTFDVTVRAFDSSGAEIHRGVKTNLVLPPATYDTVSVTLDPVTN